MLFNWSKKEKKPLCFHEWRIADLIVQEISDGICVEFENYYELGCEKCGRTKTVDEIALMEMRRAGLLE